MSTEQNGSKAGTPSPGRLGSLSSCPACGETPTIDGNYSENKKMAFSSLRLLHFCRKSPIVTEIEAKVFDAPGTWTENGLRKLITDKWNASCLANTGSHRPSEPEANEGSVG